MFNLKKILCKHNYVYVDKEIPKMMFPNLTRAENYIFRCEKCGNIIVIDNYKVIKKIQSIFIKILNEELNKPRYERMKNEDIIKKTWDSFSNNQHINTTLRKNINHTPIKFRDQEMRDIKERDILSLKFYVEGAWIISDFIDRELYNGNIRYMVVLNKNGKYKCIRNTRFEINVEDEVKRLKGIYLRKGVKMSDKDLEQEAVINVAKRYKIQYKQ